MGAIPDSVDVLVAGAGPAGLTAALHLRAAGASVLVVDARARLGHPVRCGEVTREKTFQTIGLEPRPEWIRWKLQTPEPLLVLHRPRMEEDLGRLVGERGGAILTGTSVVDLGPFDGQGRWARISDASDSRRVRARAVIAADGVASGIARRAGIDTRLPLDAMASCLAWRLVAVKIEDRARFYQFRPPALRPFYFWIIPSGPNEANVGLCVPAARGHAAPAILEREIRERRQIRGGRIAETIVGLFPSAPPLERPFTDGLLVAGTAARLIDAMTGEGIWQAAESGRAAARVLADLGAAAATAERLEAYRTGLEGLYQDLQRAASWRSYRRAPRAR